MYILIDLALGILLFFIINWIGKHSYSIGYMEISIFVKTEEAPALNFLIRVLTPIVYIILCSSILYYFNLDKFVHNIYLVNIIYIIFRLLFNIFTNRGLLLNWYRQFLYWGAIIVISYITYDKIIKIKSNILPDFTTIANELWIIILIFIFQITNNIRLSQEKTQERKDKYLKNRYTLFKSKFGDLIRRSTDNGKLEILVYSIMIYEDFNRPKAIRVIENLYQQITKKTLTLGIMQVRTDKLITDKESIEIAIDKISKAKESYIKQIKSKEDYYEYYAISSILEDYNSGSNYNNEIIDLIDIIKNEFYRDSNDEIITKDELENISK